MRVRPWSRVTPAEYASLDLEAHALLADAPVHDIWRVFLPGEERDCTMEDVRRVAETMIRSGPHGVVVPALFTLRRILGSVFAWDRTTPSSESRVSKRVPEALRRSSLVSPGTEDGPFRVVYVLDHEAVSETRNATVEAYLVWSLQPAAGGHDLLWAVHVLPTGPLTRPYLALIGPFRRFLVYPKLLERFREEWKRSAFLSP